MIHDGKTYRNLEGQVEYLTDVSKQLDDRITEVAANIPSKMIVAALPETGDPKITYYVGPKGTSPNFYYEVWVWVQEVEDGPFVWRELEDTDQVDLSGYLQKVETTTEYPQVYTKYGNGTQAMLNASTGASPATAGFVVLRASGGHISLPGSPTEGWQATNKNYVDNNFVAKQTGVTTYPQVYGKNADGTQGMWDGTTTNVANSVVVRDSGGRVRCSNPENASAVYDAINLGYANGHYLAKNTATSSYFQFYAKNTDGTQSMCNANANVTGGAAVIRRSNGNIAVPETPLENGDAASKKYVDDNATGVRYIHQLQLTYTTAPDEYLTVMATLVDRSSLPITSISYEVFRNMSLQYGDHGQNLAYNPVMVVKCPNSFHGHDFPDPIDGVYWKDLNNNTEGFATSASMTLSVSDYVSLF